MEDHENEKGSDKQQKVQFDPNRNQTHLLNGDATSRSSSSHTSDSSIESTLTDKDDGDFLPTSHQPSFDLDGPLQGDASAAHPMNGRPAGYDPNRIPSSVFSSRPNTPMDWSVASNESLFSIHMGNNSFSRDQAFLLYRSGELMKLDEVFSVQTALPPVAEVTTVERASASSLMDVREPKLSPAKTTNAVSPGNSSPETLPQNPPALEPPTAFPELRTSNAGPTEASSKNTKPAEPPEFEEDKGRVPPPSPSQNEDVRNSMSISTHSDGSGTSTGSFAFPIFGGGDMKNSSNKVAKEEQSSPDHQLAQDQQPQPPPEEKPKPSKGIMGNWFACFSCCSFHCSLSLK